MHEDLIELTSDLVCAYVSNNAVPASELSALIASVADSLGKLGTPDQQPPDILTPPVSIKKSVTPDYLISFEDGQRYKTLKRHLSIRGLTPNEYREKWGLPRDYPMVSAAYSQQRSQLAKQVGLGRKPVAMKPAPKRRKPSKTS